MLPCAPLEEAFARGNLTINFLYPFWKRHAEVGVNIFFLKIINPGIRRHFFQRLDGNGDQRPLVLLFVMKSRKILELPCVTLVHLSYVLIVHLICLRCGTIFLDK
jgi:hypothetical protein